MRHRPGSDSVPDGHVRLWPNGSDLEASRCARIMVPGSVKHNRPTSSFPASDSVSFFHKRPGSYSAILVLMAMSGCGQMDPIRKQTGVQNSLGPVLAKRNRRASCFPHSIRFRSSTDGLDHIVRNRPGSDLVLDGHVRLWPNGSGPEASWCARIIGPGSGKTEPALFWQNATGPVLAKRNRPRSGKTEPALFWQNATGPVLAKRNRPCSGKTEPARFWQNGTGPVLAKRNRPCSGKTQPALFWQNGTGPVLAKRNRPESDSTLDGHVRSWPNGSGLEASRCARIIGPVSRKTELARFWQNATDPDPIWFWMAMSGCGQMDPIRKQAGVQESSGSVSANRFQAGSEPYLGRFQHVYWDCLLPVDIFSE